MLELKRIALLSIIAAALCGSSGCCCCSPCGSCGGGCSSCGGGCGGCAGGCGGGCGLCGLLSKRELPDDYRGAGSYWCDCGCGELYCGDWHSYPPDCDPCDCCGNYIGPQDHIPGYQLPPRVGTTGRAPPPPGADMSVPSEAPPPPTPPNASSRKRRSSGAAVQASYEAPQHCPTCGN